MNSWSMRPYRFFAAGARVGTGMNRFFLAGRSTLSMATPAFCSVGKSSTAISFTTSSGTVSKCVEAFLVAPFVFGMVQEYWGLTHTGQIFWSHNWRSCATLRDQV